VTNDGPVISHEDLARMVQPFERLRRGSAPGTGLGRAIVSEIAEAHRGRLALEAPPGGGLIARLAIPSA
jgi:signal transduction histidine kinase